MIAVIQLNFSPEDKLLLYCSRINLTEDIENKIKEILSEALDWDYIVDHSQNQGIFPLVYWNLSKIKNGNYVPLEIIKSLEKLYYGNLARNMILYEELKNILTVFKEADIEVIVLKGAFLAKEIYKNIGLRPMNDIDLLIREEDFKKVKNELSRLIYSTDVFYTKYYEQLHTVLSNELLFTSKNKKICIDLHWDILSHESCYKVDIIKFWENTKIIKIVDVESRILAPEDLLQHLCLHLDSHINSRSGAQYFKDYCDIAEVTRHYKETINWNYLLKSTKSYGIEKPVFENLSFANRYFGAIIPDDILSVLEPELDIGFRETLDEISEDNLKKKDNENIIKHYVKKLEKVDSNWQKLNLLFGYVIPSKEYIMYHYSIKNEKRIYIYYLIHLGEILQWALPILGKLPNYICRSALSK